jgi:hypothetical protein
LPNAKATRPKRYSYDRGWLIIAALLKAIRKSELIDIEASVKGFYRNNKVHVLKSPRYLATQVDKMVPGLACKRSGYKELVHHDFQVDRSKLHCTTSLACGKSNLTQNMRITNHVRGTSRGVSVTTIEAVIFGMMLSWTPCALLMAYLLWRSPTEPE